MTKTIYAIHKPDGEKLIAVRRVMEALGAPTIKVVDCGDYYMALEGSHRLAAAKSLGLIPTLEIYDQDDVINVTKFDWCTENFTDYPDTYYSAAEIAGDLYSREAVAYDFE